ncbi:MAG: NAD-dependent epimerase/dehydratase family protein, partial [Bryobacteraceae bacterium]
CKMRLLIIGGTGFIGASVLKMLAAEGHDLAVFHRGVSRPRLSMGLPAGVREILGDQRELTKSAPELRDFSPDVVVHFILSSERQAQTTMEVFRGIARRIVALSSGDVYRAAGILHGTEPGPLQPVPLTEESDLRTKGQTYSKEAMQSIRKSLPWVDDEYDKIPVERAIMSHPELVGTILRLPMVYGPGDRFRRLYPYLKRMDDDRPAILIQEDAAQWRGPRGYVENVAAGIALAATASKAAGRIYNLAEPQSFSELEWVQRIACAAKWPGSVLPVPADLIPAHLKLPYNSAQHWTMSSARIRDELGYAEPVPLETALARTIEWERANPPPQFDPSQFDYVAEDAAIERLHFGG